MWEAGVGVPCFSRFLRHGQHRPAYIKPPQMFIGLSGKVRLLGSASACFAGRQKKITEAQFDKCALSRQAGVCFLLLWFNKLLRPPTVQIRTAERTKKNDVLGNVELRLHKAPGSPRAEPS